MQSAWMRSAFGSTRMSRGEIISRRSRMMALNTLASTVAVATPSTVMWSTATKNRFISTFRIPETTRAWRGTFVSPTLRKMAASKL